jgi:(p)ppGpp synthase/HD superfamily hydrolase
MDNPKIAVALSLATQWHFGEIRKYTNGEPYIVHPVGVAAILRTVAHTWELIAAALLHDVLEVPDVLRVQREAIIRYELGETVLQLVLEVTNPSKPEDGNRKVRKAIDRAHLAKASPAGQTLRLGDSIHNLENLYERAPRFAKDYAAEKKLILPLTIAGDATLHARAGRIIEMILSV